MDAPDGAAEPAYAHPGVAAFYAFFKVRENISRSMASFCFLFSFSTIARRALLTPSLSFLHSSPSFSIPSLSSFREQISALLVYILCGLFSKSFVANFVVVIVLLMADFWTVSLISLFSLTFVSLSLSSSPFLFPCLQIIALLQPSLYLCLNSFFDSPKNRNEKTKHQLQQTKNVAGRLLVGLRWWNEVTDTGSSNWRFETLQEGQRAVNKKDAAIFWWLLYGTPPAWLLLGLVAAARLKLDYLLVVAVALVLAGSNVVGYTKCSKRASAQVRSYAAQAMAHGLTAAMARV